MTLPIQIAATSLADEIRRISGEQSSKALQALQSIEAAATASPPDEDAVDEAVHTARKSLKKARAVARLARDAIGEVSYQRANRMFRDAGRLLAPARDSFVMVNTFDGLAHDHPGHFANAAALEIRSALAKQHAVYRQELLHDGETVAEAIDLVRSAQDGVRFWTVQGRDFDILQNGLRRTYKRGRKRMHEAYAEPAPARFHQWRKRAKYHRYHIRMLKQLWPAVLSATVRELHALTDTLGDANDLAMLHTFLQNRQYLLSNGDSGSPLTTLLLVRQHELFAAARHRGARLYAEAPKQHVQRMRSYWHATVADVSQEPREPAAA